MVVVLGLLRRKEQRRLSERNRNQKRRDKKGRILRNGESQRADGRYAFVYTDCFLSFRQMVGDIAPFIQYVEW